MRAFYADHFVLPLPAGHRFPMEKYARLRQRVAEELPWVRLEVPDAATDALLAHAHDPEYVRRVASGELTRQEVRAIGFPWSPEMVERSRRSAGATLAACRAALDDGLSANLAGGTHHAKRAQGAGFCVFNDAAIAARVLLAEGAVARVAIIDCDVHQGDGTAEILAGEPRAFTLSLHGANNFPYRKERSSIDVELPDGTGDVAYLGELARALERLFDRFAPDLAIYLAGADPFEGDRLGRLKLGKGGLAARDRLVFDRCSALGVPVAIAMAGGYAANVEDTVDIHFATVREAATRWAEHSPGCLAVSLSERA